MRKTDCVHLVQLTGFEPPAMEHMRFLMWFFMPIYRCTALCQEIICAHPPKVV